MVQISRKHLCRHVDNPQSKRLLRSTKDQRDSHKVLRFLSLKIQLFCTRRSQNVVKQGYHYATKHALLTDIGNFGNLTAEYKYITESMYPWRPRGKRNDTARMWERQNWCLNKICFRCVLVNRVFEP